MTPVLPLPPLVETIRSGTTQEVFDDDDGDVLSVTLRVVNPGTLDLPFERSRGDPFPPLTSVSVKSVTFRHRNKERSQTLSLSNISYYCLCSDSMS